MDHLPLPVPETVKEESDLLVTTSERSSSRIEVVISDLKESMKAVTGELTRVQERLTDLEELIKQKQKQLSFTIGEEQELVEVLRHLKAGAGDVAKQKDLCERVEKLENSFKLENSDKVSETKTELETEHISASCTTANAASGPAHSEPISDTLHTLIEKLGAVVSEMSVRPRFRSRGQSFARYRVRTSSQLSSDSSGVGFSHEFEDSGSFVHTMSPVPPADRDQTASIERSRARTTSVSIRDSSLNNLVFAMDDLATAIKNYLQAP